MKKYVCFIVCIVMVFLMTSSAFATVDDDSDTSLKDMFEQAVFVSKTRSLSSEICPVNFSTNITNDEGDVYTVQMFEYIPASESYGTSHSKTFVFSTQPEYVSRAIGNTQTNDGWDDSISVFGSITVTYNSRPFGTNQNVTEYLLTKVSGKWERSDSTVSLSNRFVAYTCQYIFTPNQVTWKYPTSNTFSYNTGYTKYIPDDSATGVLGATSSVDLAHGSSSRWTLTTQANVFENDIADLL